MERFVKTKHRKIVAFMRNYLRVIHKSISSKKADFFRYREWWVVVFSVKNDELD